MKYNKKTKNRTTFVNARLRQAEPRFIKMYQHIEAFVKQLESQGTLLDHNFHEFIRVYSPNKLARLRCAKEIDKPIIDWHNLTYMTLYMKDETYRKSWDTDFIDSGCGWASPLLKSLRDNNHHIDIEDMQSIEKIVIGVKVDYQVLVDLNFSYRHKLSRLEKWTILNQKLKKAEEELHTIISKERETCADLYKQNLIDTDHIKQSVELFTRDKKANTDFVSRIGDPFWEQNIDWTTLFALNQQAKDWSSTNRYSAFRDKPIQEPICYTTNIINELMWGSHRYISIIDCIWLEHTVEYAMVLDFKREKVYL